MIAGIEDVVQHIDRAHRIGKSYHQKIEKKCKSIIVKFVSFRHRTKVYKKRKNLNDGVTVHPANIHLQKTPSKRLDQGQYIRLGHMSSRRLARLQDVLQKRLQDIFRTFWRRFEDVSGKYCKDDVTYRRICLGHTSEKFMVSVQNLQERQQFLKF